MLKFFFSHFLYVFNLFPIILFRTTAVTEKAAQLSQEINHMLQSNFDYHLRDHSRTPSEAATAAFPPSEDGQVQENAYRTTSHFSLPNSWQGNTRSSPSASSILIRELQVRFCTTFQFHTFMC